MPNLIISDIQVRQDAEGRYSLNDLHRASGGNPKHKPANWLRSQQVIDLIGLLKSEQSPRNLDIIESKQWLGTFICKELVYDYAMWISPAFKVKVIRAYHALATQPQAALCREAYQLASDGYDGILAELTERARHYLRTGIPEADILDCLKRKGFGRASPIQPEDLKPLLAQASELFNRLNDLMEGGSELCAKRMR
jgi:hypothetical protein